MKYRNFYRILSIFLLTLSAIQLEGQAWKGKGRVTGSVTDTQGNPLESVTVFFSSERLETSTEVKTDKDGKFIMHGIQGGIWNIDFKKEGYKTEMITTSILSLSYNKPMEIKLQKLEAVQASPSAKEIPGMALMHEGKQLAEAKDYAGAIAKYEAALQLNPSLYHLHGEIGNVYEQTGEPDKAMEAYKKFLESEPQNQQALISIAGLWLDKGNLEEGKKMLAGLTFEGITDAYLPYNLGVRFYNANLATEAIRCFRKTVEVDPMMVDAHLQLGFALASPSANDIVGAKRAFQKVIELDPNSENAKLAKEFLDLMK